MSFETIETALPDPSDICMKCHSTWGDLLSFAMLMDLGASVWPSPLECDHEFDSKRGQVL